MQRASVHSNETAEPIASTPLLPGRRHDRRTAPRVHYRQTSELRSNLGTSGAAAHRRPPRSTVMLSLLRLGAHDTTLHPIS